MKKMIIITVVGTLICTGCEGLWESSSWGLAQQRVRSQKLAQEKFIELYAQAEKEGNHELCLKILESYARSLPQYRSQPISSSVIDNGEAWHRHQQEMNQLRMMEHKASFERMRQGGLP
jgi:hypothetical protein